MYDLRIASSLSKTTMTLDNQNGLDGFAISDSHQLEQHHDGLESAIHLVQDYTLGGVDYENFRGDPLKDSNYAKDLVKSAKQKFGLHLPKLDSDGFYRFKVEYPILNGSQGKMIENNDDGNGCTNFLKQNIEIALAKKAGSFSRRKTVVMTEDPNNRWPRVLRFCKLYGVLIWLQETNSSFTYSPGMTMKSTNQDKITTKDQTVIYVTSNENLEVLALMVDEFPPKMVDCKGNEPYFGGFRIQGEISQKGTINFICKDAISTPMFNTNVLITADMVRQAIKKYSEISNYEEVELGLVLAGMLYTSDGLTSFSLPMSNSLNDLSSSSTVMQSINVPLIDNYLITGCMMVNAQAKAMIMDITAHYASGGNDAMAINMHRDQEQRHLVYAISRDRYFSNSFDILYHTDPMALVSVKQVMPIMSQKYTQVYWSVLRIKHRVLLNSFMQVVMSGMWCTVERLPDLGNLQERCLVTYRVLNCCETVPSCNVNEILCDEEEIIQNPIYRYLSNRLKEGELRLLPGKVQVCLLDSQRFELSSSFTDLKLNLQTTG